MAEAIMHQIGGRFFDAFSAGPAPVASVHPQALETLSRNRIPTDGLAPKDVTTFAGQSFDFVVSLCDREREAPPTMPGADVIPWTFEDPARHPDERTRARAFESVFHGLETRIRLLL